MIHTQLIRLGLPTFLLAVMSLPAAAQSFRVQCPTSTITHPTASANNAEPAYSGPTVFTSTSPTAPASGYQKPASNVNGAIKCQQIAGGDGYATMADGTQTYMFSFGPLSGLAGHVERPARHGIPERLQHGFPGHLAAGRSGDDGWRGGQLLAGRAHRQPDERLYLERGGRTGA